MGILNPIQHEHSETTQRWEERYGDGPVKLDHGVTEKYVRIGDEIFSVEELEKAHVENPQPVSHPFKPHHYLVQEAMDDLKKHFAKGGSKPA